MDFERALQPPVEPLGFSRVSLAGLSANADLLVDAGNDRRDLTRTLIEEIFLPLMGRKQGCSFEMACFLVEGSNQGMQRAGLHREFLPQNGASLPPIFIRAKASLPMDASCIHDSSLTLVQPTKARNCGLYASEHLLRPFPESPTAAHRRRHRGNAVLNMRANNQRREFGPVGIIIFEGAASRIHLCRATYPSSAVTHAFRNEDCTACASWMLSNPTMP